jgi:CDP-paratose 2-epimerase
VSGAGSERGADAPVLVTGGAGFIGTNVVDRLVTAGQRVIVYDNLSRDGVTRNLAWLQERHGDRVEVQVADVRDVERLRRAVDRASHVFHFAAQVAVTTSLVDPVADFEVNARGTLNVLDAIRRARRPPSLLYTSTNKVYGALGDVALAERDGCYGPTDPALAAAGLDERRPLDLYSPYGCSKGCADQYVLDHARMFGLRATVFRMSCIYGQHQCGNEDQGWVAHFVIRALAEQPITIYGNGMQVRDALHIDDLADAMLLARASLAHDGGPIAGQAFNIGGGPGNAVSLLDLVERIADCTGRRATLEFGPWRPGDQRYYVTNTGKFQRATGWAPQVSVAQGVRRLAQDLLSLQIAQTPRTPLAQAGASTGSSP